MESQEKAEELIRSERDEYISFRDSRGIYHELNTRMFALFNCPSISESIKVIKLE